MENVCLSYLKSFVGESLSLQAECEQECRCLLLFEMRLVNNTIIWELKGKKFQSAVAMIQ